MPRILLLLFLTIPPWLASKYHAPKWALLLSVVPFGLLAMSMGDPDEHMFGEASKTVGRYLFLLLGVGGVAIGAVAWSLRGSATILGAFWWILPVAVAVLLMAIARFFRK